MESFVHSFGALNSQEKFQSNISDEKKAWKGKFLKRNFTLFVVF